MQTEKGTRLRRAVAVLVMLAVLPIGALAQGLELAEGIRGMQVYPQGASEEQAAYLFRYEYPQFAVQSPPDEAINAYYRAICEDMGQLPIPQSVAEMLEMRQTGEPAYYTAVTYQIMANTAEYLSVTLTSQQFLGYSESDRIEGNVFARDGVYAGQMVTLSQVMGMEEEGGELDANASYASQLVYKLVWQIMMEQQASQQKDFFEGLAQADLEAVFSPEMDFYLDGDHNLVFFIQAGGVAGEVEGILTYPFSRAELLSAVKNQ